jgi:hypothetical protein
MPAIPSSIIKNYSGLTIINGASAIAQRAKLLTRTWGAAGLPTDNAATTDGITFSYRAPGSVLATYSMTLYQPTGGGDNGIVVVYHQGHGEGGTITDVNAQLLPYGFRVLRCSMPGDSAGGYNGNTIYRTIGGPALHTYMFYDLGIGAYPYFFYGVNAAINYLKSQGFKIGMGGTSGGAWTTLHAAAQDERIRHSFLICGSAPQHLRRRWGPAGDYEQKFPGMYSGLDVLDLHALGCTDKRTQRVYYNSADTIGFTGAHDLNMDYKTPISALVAAQFGGTFDMVVVAGDATHYPLYNVASVWNQIRADLVAMS